MEHGIGNDGKISEINGDIDNGYSTFFGETEAGRVVPRSIFVDTESSVIGNWSLKFVYFVLKSFHLWL